MSGHDRSRRPLIALILSVMAFARCAGAADNLNSPVGTWKTIDDKTGKARGIVRVYEQGGALFARIERVLTSGDEARTCTKCTDARKDQPIVGLVFMRNLHYRDGEFRDGDILDPQSGTVYRCRIRLASGGTRLVVRGFVGVSLFGRSQTWEREP